MEIGHRSGHRPAAGRRAIEPGMRVVTAPTRARQPGLQEPFQPLGRANAREPRAE
jgi:hypothetical protein